MGMMPAAKQDSSSFVLSFMSNTPDFDLELKNRQKEVGARPENDTDRHDSVVTVGGEKKSMEPNIKK
jgi:hypothetical protein